MKNLGGKVSTLVFWNVSWGLENGERDRNVQWTGFGKEGRGWLAIVRNIIRSQGYTVHIDFNSLGLPPFGPYLSLQRTPISIQKIDLLSTRVVMVVGLDILPYIFRKDKKKNWQSFHQLYHTPQDTIFYHLGITNRQSVKTTLSFPKRIQMAAFLAGVSRRTAWSCEWSSIWLEKAAPGVVFDVVCIYVLFDSAQEPRGARSKARVGETSTTELGRMKWVMMLNERGRQYTRPDRDEQMKKGVSYRLWFFSEGSRLKKIFSNPLRDLVYTPSRYKILPGIDIGITNVIDSKQNTDFPPSTTWLRNLHSVIWIQQIPISCSFF